MLKKSALIVAYNAKSDCWLKCTDVLDVDGVFKTEFFQAYIGILLVVSVMQWSGISHKFL